MSNALILFIQLLFFTSIYSQNVGDSLSIRDEIWEKVKNGEFSDISISLQIKDKSISKAIVLDNNSIELIEEKNDSINFFLKKRRNYMDKTEKEIFFESPLFHLIFTDILNKKVIHNHNENHKYLISLTYRNQIYEKYLTKDLPQDYLKILLTIGLAFDEMQKAKTENVEMFDRDYELKFQ